MDDNERVALAVLERNFSCLDKGFSEVKAEIKEVKVELKAEIAAVRTEIKAEVIAVRTEMKTEITAIRTEMKNEITAVRTEMKDGFQRLDEKIDSKFLWMLGALGGVVILITGFIYFFFESPSG